MEDRNEQERYRCCFLEWMQLQEADLDELLRAKASASSATDAVTPTGENELRNLVAKNIQHYEDYSARRNSLAREDPTSFFCPQWCSSFENSFLWIGGCRPSMVIRLLYTLSGTELESRLDEFLRGVSREDLSELSARQLRVVNELHLRTLREEDSLTSRMASLQEDVADKPLVPMACNRRAVSREEVKNAMGTYGESLARIMEEADRLRVGTLRELLGILSPLQAVVYLAAAKQLQLSVHEWGTGMDRAHGRD